MDSRISIDQKRSGKIILTGEHTILYGGEALVSPISKYVDVKVRQGNGEISTIINGVKDNINYFNDPLVNAALLHLEEFYDIDLVNLNIEIRSEIPIGGFGSSSAIVASIIESVLAFKGVEIGDSNLIEDVIAIESSLGTKVSGIDQITIVKEKPLVFQRIDGDLKYREADLLYLSDHKVLVINTGRPNSTTNQVVKVVRQRFESSNPYKSLIANTIELNRNLICSIESNSNEQTILRLVDDISENLIKMGIVSGQSQAVIKTLNSMGLHVKLSGAGTISEGPSGALIAFCAIDFDSNQIRDLGFNCFEM
ncbi:MAG: hypothetical protein ABIM99_00880 [Candidatus Dojkabacteria bacterium]